MQSYCESGNKFFTVELVEYTNVISWMVVWFKEESNSMLLPDGLVLTFEDLNFSLSNSKKKKFATLSWYVETKYTEVSANENARNSSITVEVRYLFWRPEASAMHILA